MKTDTTGWREALVQRLNLAEKSSKECCVACTSYSPAPPAAGIDCYMLDPPIMINNQEDNPQTQLQGSLMQAIPQ